LRGIYPVVATIGEQGFQRVSDDELAERFARIAQEREEREERQP
jgi:hypothetical protein